ncbi:hypothetical protein Tco_0218523 [Tanacetum coccineum]
MQRKTQSWKKQREPTFQVVLDALALTPCYSAFLTTADVPEVYMHQLWDSIHKSALEFMVKTLMNFPHMKILYLSSNQGHTGEIKSITDVFVDQMHQPWRTFFLLSSTEVYLERQSVLTSFVVLQLKSFEECVVIRDTPVMSLSKKKEKVTVKKCKGINLLSEVALTEEAQYEEVRKKSLRDFYKTHPSGSGTVTKIAPSATKIKPYVTNEGTGAKPRVPDNEEAVEDDEEEKDDEFVKTSSNSTDDEDETNEESMAKDKVKVIEDALVTISTATKKTEVLVTSSSYSSDLASKFLKFLDIPHTDAEIVSPIDVHVHLEVPSNQTLLTVPLLVSTESSPVFSTIILQSLPSFTPSPPQSTPTPPPATEATNPLSALPNFAFVIQFNNRVLALEKEVAELKKDDLLNT